MFFMRIILVCLMLSVFSQGLAQQEVLGLEELRKSLKRQEKIILRLQSLISEQNLRQDELERSQPPVDLLESLYTDLKSMQEDLKEYMPRLAKIEELEKARVPGRPEKEKEIIMRGMLALLAGNPDDAAKHFQPMLNQDTPKDLKHDLLMALGHSYLARDHPEQAASYFGTAIDLSRKGSQYPHALFYLGLSFQALGDQEKRDVVWKELSSQFLNHPLTLKSQTLQDGLQTPAEGLDKQNPENY